MQKQRSKLGGKAICLARPEVTIEWARKVADAVRRGGQIQGVLYI